MTGPAFAAVAVWTHRVDAAAWADGRADVGLTILHVPVGVPVPAVGDVDDAGWQCVAVAADWRGAVMAMEAWGVAERRTQPAPPSGRPGA